MSEPSEFFSVTELASLLAVKDAKIHTWIATGELSAFNVATKRGNRPRWRISRDAFSAFQAARSAVPVAAPTTRKPRRESPKLTRKWIT